jgi:hypothetical protein
MSPASIGLAAPAQTTGGFHVSTIVIVIVLIVAVVSALAIIGWREPDRSPGVDTKAQRDRIED